METASLETQREFLHRYGEGKDPMAEGEVGKAFKVLLQRK
jgi:hypothetical protein